MTTPALWVERAGAGPLVVLVHGSLDRAAGLVRLSRRLDGRHHVVRYDRRGYGRSRPHPGPFGMAGQVDDLLAVLDGRPAVVVGHSYGGDVALAAAVAAPELVHGVVVYEPPMPWLDWWPTTTAGAAALDRAADPAGAAEGFMRGLLGDERWERLPPATRTARREEGVVMLGELDDLRRRPPWTPERVRVPVVAMRGELGAEHHRRGVEHLGASVPGCRTVVVPGARHFGPSTHAADVAAVVEALVAGAADGARPQSPRGEGTVTS